MSSAAHAVIVEILEAHPEALSYLLELQGNAPEGALIPTTGTRTKTFVLERRVDRAYLIGSRTSPIGFVLTEVQLDIDEDKPFAWPLYLELGRSRYRCEGALVVLTTSEAVRRWIERAIEPSTGICGTSRMLKPTVIALDKIDPSLLLSPDRPYLAPLAIAGHANAKQVAETAVDLTLDCLPKPLAVEQLDGILGMVNDALRAHLERRIMEHREYRSEFFRNIFKKGQAEGKVEGKAEGILAFLAAREIPVSDAIRARILNCTDESTLDIWIRRAAVAPTAAAVVRTSEPKSPPSGRPRRRPRNA
ncbi:MAG: hypothetical protein L6Q76_13345 [Polyangiaceae bacterium]|nr:hypothetical protein [Polyangiaceae bacterium]